MVTEKPFIFHKHPSPQPKPKDDEQGQCDFDKDHDEDAGKDGTGFAIRQWRGTRYSQTSYCDLTHLELRC